jgi:hypothetical protein
MMGPQDTAKSIAEVKSRKHIVQGETDDLFSPEDMKVIYGQGSMGTGDDYDEQVGNAIVSSFEPQTSAPQTTSKEDADKKKVEDL